MVKKLFKGILKGTLKLMVLGMVFFVFCTISNNRAEKNMADALESSEINTSREIELAPGETKQVFNEKITGQSTDNSVATISDDFHGEMIQAYQNTLSEFVEYLKNDDIEKIPEKDKVIIRKHAVLKDLLTDF